jgi:hypothetical protein
MEGFCDSGTLGNGVNGGLLNSKELALFQCCRPLE